jgi:Capsule polysaccharide biosynthesis protein
MSSLPKKIKERARRFLGRDRAVTPTAPSFFPHPDWRQLIGKDWPLWQQAVEDAQTGPEILIATSAGRSAVVTQVESLLAVALTLRGAHVSFLLCDAVLPACSESMIDEQPVDVFTHLNGPQSICQDCFDPAQAAYSALGLRVYRYGEFITAEQRLSAHEIAQTVPIEEIQAYRWEGLAVGEHAYAGALRYYARGTLGADVPQSEAVMQRFLEAAILSASSLQGLMQQVPFHTAVFNHGIYVPQGLVGEIARQRQIHTVNWALGYRQRTIILSHQQSYHFTMIDEPTSSWSEMIWGAEQEDKIIQYLDSREGGSQDWVKYHPNAQSDLEAIASEVGLDPTRPWIGLLTNVMWDAQLFYSSNAFRSMLEWTLKTIEYFSTRPDLQLVIRIHPAEVRGTMRSRQPLAAEIRAAFPSLPPNVFVIPAESKISTYAVMRNCNAVIIYGTKTGMELTSIGVPVIVAGEAWIRNKGITRDASNTENYYRILEELPFRERLSPAVITQARKYAFHFFFRRLVPLEPLEFVEGWPPYRINLAKLADLAVGNNRGLDIICDGILKGSDFVYPAEQYSGMVVA